MITQHTLGKIYHLHFLILSSLSLQSRLHGLCIVIQSKGLLKLDETQVAIDKTCISIRLKKLAHDHKVLQATGV